MTDAVIALIVVLLFAAVYVLTTYLRDRANRRHLT
jgi:hypothetical protein